MVGAEGHGWGVRWPNFGCREGGRLGRRPWFALGSYSSMCDSCLMLLAVDGWVGRRATAKGCVRRACHIPYGYLDASGPEGGHAMKESLQQARPSVTSPRGWHIGLLLRAVAATGGCVWGS